MTKSVGRPTKPFIALKELKILRNTRKITFELKEKSLESVKKDIICLTIPRCGGGGIRTTNPEGSRFQACAIDH